MQFLLLFILVSCIGKRYLLLASALDESLTPTHQQGRCAMRGQCDSSIFASLPCVDNGPASLPDTEDFRKQLVDTCGTSYQEGPVCCDSSQLGNLMDQVKRAEPIISSCPACWENFMQFWCSFTCSPNQSTFVNITSSYTKDNKAVVDQADYWVGDGFGSQFFDSCKDIKFGSSNGYAMEFIGGGATDWQGLVKFMGKKQLLGSPFQIDFPSLDATPRDGLARYDDGGQSCSEGAYRCACVDCQAACPVLPPTDGETPECYVGLLRCWSFAMVASYGSILVLVSIWFISRQRWMMLWIQHWWYDNHDASTRGMYEPVALSEDQHYNNLDDTNDDDDDDDNSNNQHHEMLLDPDHTPRRYWLNTRLQSWFYFQGLFCARHPWLVITLGLVFVSLLSCGWSRFSVERDPVHLWVARDSKALAEKTHFDENFSPFYRTTQLFLVSESQDQSVLSASRLEYLFALEKEISTMVSDQHGVSLQDVCFHPNGDACIVQSVTGYWQGDVANFDSVNWRDDLDACVSDPASCLPESLQPLKPQMVLGGYKTDDNGRTDYLDAKAMVVTFVLQNSLNTTDIDKAHDWEVSLLSHVLSKVNDRPEWNGVRITYSTESSLEIELNQSSNTDGLTVAISYLVMFLYASVALGRFTSWKFRRLVVESKFSLGVCGILIVIFSVSASVGVFSLTGRKTTLIIAEVIPFLVLAVGVDNIFILCHEFDRRRRAVEQNDQHSDDGADDVDGDDGMHTCSGGESIQESAAKTLGKMGPSILLSSLSETIAFGLGTLVSMPAVSSFAIVASTAVFVDFLLQVTCFVSCMVLDARRTEANRMDCFPCIRLRVQDKVEKEGWFETCWRRGFVPMVLCHKTSIITCLGFLGVFMFNLAMVPQVALGLDQRIALPSDSYLVPYFNDLDAYFNVGPPLYFVVTGANLTERSGQKQICGRFPGCDEHSLATILEQERKRPQVSYIGEPTSVWLDDYFLWTNPNFQCCQLKKQRRRQQSMKQIHPWTASSRDGRKLCGDFDMNCEPCVPDWLVSDMDTLPEGQEFLEYYDLWINMPPSETCPLGGKAAYGDAIVVSNGRGDDGQSVGTIETSHFRTFHTPLKNQNDFIQAYAAARRIANQLGDSLDLDVYPYSVFYIFFEQYGQIIKMAVELLGLAMVAIFVITSALLGSLRSGTIVMVVVFMILTNVIGTMALWGISLNAVSLVNLVICVGISVEFCCHIARAFMVSSGTKEERAAKSLTDVGSSVFCGITLTKFAGIIVLAFTKSKIFEVYYFRMYLTIVVYGALHGLILLPILLSLYGGKGMSLLSEFNENGFVWDWHRNEQGLLIEDRDSFDQVLVTDMPSRGRQGRSSNGALE
ncbi:unnamed protein product [Absidia cylindrospora]